MTDLSLDELQEAADILRLVHDGIIATEKRGMVLNDLFKAGEIHVGKLELGRLGGVDR